MNSNNVYLWKKPEKELARCLLERMLRQERASCWSEVSRSATKAFCSYYNRYFLNNDNIGIGAAGEQGELMTISANHFGSLVRSIVGLTTQERLTFATETGNNDIESRDVAIIADAILEDYFYRRNFEAEIIKMVELGMLGGTSYLEVCWEPQYKLVGTDEDGEMAFVGRPKFKSYNVFDVYVENPYEDDFDKQNWVVTKSPENRYDLAAKYPKLEKEILNLPSIDKSTHSHATQFLDDDSVWVYKGIHRESPAMPSGRMIIFCEHDVVLKDHEANPYVDMEVSMSPNRGLNIFCFRPSVRHGRHFGYSRAFDLLALQDNLNILTSTVATNQASFGVQNIAVPRSAKVQRSQIGSTTNVYEYDADENGAGIPKILELLKTPTEIFNYMQDLVLQMETISGINAIMRGKVTTSIPPTGVAAALLTAQGQISNSDVEKGYYRIVEQAAMFLLYVIAMFQKTEDVITIAGKDKQREAKTFVGAQIKGIRGARATVGNPLAKTLAGKIGILEVGVNSGMVKTPDQFMEVLQTGNLKQELEGGTAELNLIRWENEKLRNAQVIEEVDPQTGAPRPIVKSGSSNILVGYLDNPVRHIMEHKVVMDDPNVRQNANVLNAVTIHIQQHLDQLDIMQENYPQVLAMLFGQPLPMPQPSQGSGIQDPNAQEMGNLSKGDLEGLEGMMGKTMTAEAGDVGDGAAMGGLKAAQNKLAQASGEIA